VNAQNDFLPLNSKYLIISVRLGVGQQLRPGQHKLYFFDDYTDLIHANVVPLECNLELTTFVSDKKASSRKIDVNFFTYFARHITQICPDIWIFVRQLEFMVLQATSDYWMVHLPAGCEPNPSNGRMYPSKVFSYKISYFRV